MSKTIDERVVEMRFDNKQFESGVQTSLSTLDKLKKGLNLDGAAKGFDQLGAAAKKCDMSVLGRSVETVQAKFSAFEVVAMTALSNITNSVLRTGKQVAAAFTIDPIKSGFQEYETQIGAVQTILANTSHQGTNLQQVNRALNELNTYADKTIYNFTEMTRNIGTFTAAGIDLQTSVDSIKGIANLAAVSGSTSQQASTAMYQLSQALSAGKVSLMDWNSVVNAGMGGKVFQDALVRTSELLKTGAQNAIKAHGSFRESLTKGEWLTTEVLTETLKQFAGAYNEADLIQQGFTEDQARSIMEMAKTAEDAATKVKTFTQLFDTLKESAQSGWTQSWEIMVGDFEEAKEILTEVSQVIGDVISNSADARNAVLRGGLSSGWKQLLSAGIADEAGYIDSIQEIAKANSDAFAKMVDDSDSFSDALKKGLQEGVISSGTLSEAVFHLQGKMSEMTAEERKAAGYTSEMLTQIEALASGLKDGSISMDDFTAKILCPSGRENLIQALWNSAKGLMSVLAPIKESFSEIFPPMTAEQLYGITENLRAMTEQFTLSESTSNDLKSTFKGLFAVLDIVSQAFSAFWRVVSPAGSTVGNLLTGILGLTGSFGDYLVKLDNVIKKSDIFYKGLKSVVDFINGAITAVTDFAAAIGESLGFPGIDEAKAAIKSFLETLKEKISVPGMERLQSIFDGICTRAKQIRDAVAGMKDGFIDSLGKIDGAVTGNKFVQVLTGIGTLIKQAAIAISGLLGKAVDGLIDTLSNANFNGILDFLNALAAGGLIAAIKKFLDPLGEMEDTFSGFTDWVKGLGGGVTKILDGVRGSLEAWQTKLKSDALGKIAAAIAVLSVSLLALASIDSDKITGSLAAMGTMFAELMTSMAVMDKLSINGNASGKMASAMIKMGAALLILSLAMKNISELNPEQLAAGLIGVGVLLAEVDLFLNTAKFDKKASKSATGMILFATAIKILSSSVQSLGNMDWDDMARGLVGVGALLAEVDIFLNTAKFSGKAVLTATGIVILASAIKILASSCEDFGAMSWEEITKGLASIAALLIEITAFTRLTGDAKHVISTGLALVEIAAAMKIFASAMSDFGDMGEEKIAKGLIAMGGALAEVAIAVNIMPKNMVGIGSGLVIVGAALKIVASALSSMGNMSWEEIGKGLAAMGGALAELAISLNVMNGTLAGSAALIVAAGALAVLAPVLLVLGNMSWESIAKGLVVIAGSFAVFGVAGHLLAPVVPIIAAISGSISLLAASLSVLMVAISGLNLTGAVAAITAPFNSLSSQLFIEVIKSFVALIPDFFIGILNSIKDFIVAFCGIIVEGAPAIGNAVNALLLMLVDVLVECAPAMANGALILISEVLAALVTYTPQIIDSVMQFLIVVLEGIARNIPQLVQAAMDVVGAFFAGVLSALSNIDSNSLIQGIAAVGLLTALVAAIGAVSGLIPSAMTGVLGMGVVIAELAVVLAAVGALAQIPGLEWLIGEGGQLLQTIGTAIGGFVGGIVGGFMGGVSDSFPQIGTNLSMFMTNAKPFIDGAGGIGPDTLTGIKTLTEAITIITAASLLEGVTSWLTGGSSLVNFAEQLVPFGKAMRSYGDAVSGIDAGAVTNSASTGKALAELANTLPKCGGLFSFFTGNSNFAGFSDDIVKFGGALSAYSSAVKGVQPEVVTASANAAQALSNLATGLPDSSIFDKWFGGDQTLAFFGKDIASLGTSISNYYSKVANIDLTKLSGVVAQIRSLMNLAKSAQGLDASGLNSLGKALKTMANTGLSELAATFSNSNTEVDAAIRKMLSSISTSISSGKNLTTPGMESVMKSLADVVTKKAVSINNSVKAMMKGVAAAIRSGAPSVQSAMKAVFSNSASGISGLKKQFETVGKNSGQGFVNGIRSKFGSSSAAGRGLGLAALNAAKKALDSHSPSREFIHLGEYMGEGLAIGAKNSIVPAAQATSKMIDEVLKVSAKGIEAFQKWAEEKKYYSELSLKDELAGYENLQKKYKAGSEERTKIDREVYRIQNELVASTYQASIDWIEEAKYYNRLSTQEEFNAYERMQKRYLEGSEERKKIDREVYNLRKQLMDESYQFSMNWIEEEKYYNRMSLSDELAAYKRVQSRYAKGTDERKKMDREVYRLEQEIYEAQKQYISDVQSAQSEANQKRLDLEEEYANKVKSINEKLASDIKSLNDKYQSSLESRANSLYQAYGLFDEVKEREAVSGETLMKNLTDQVQEFGKWQDILSSLSSRGLNSELIEELQAMGPSAIAQIEALNSMSDSELEKYAALWSIKHAQAREQAVNELEDLLIETQNNIAQLRIDAENELNEYCTVWQEKMDQVTTDVNRELEQLRKNFGEKVGLIRKDTEKETQEMVTAAQAILRGAGWDETGKQIVTGIQNGVVEEKPAFLNALTQMALEGVKAVRDTLDIHSPSGVFRKLGNYSGLGFVNGLAEYAKKSYDAAAGIAGYAADGLSDVMGTVSDLLSGDFDMQPKIRPVLDFSNVNRGVGEMNGLFGYTRTLALAGQTSLAFNSTLDKDCMTVNVDNDSVVQELRSLRKDMSFMTEKLQKMQIVMNTGALVGELAGPMDTALGQRAIYRQRGI